ncbi:MAG: exopolyphosphatase [Gammaproteobacteria bacterium]
MSSDPVESYAAVDLGSNSFHMIVAGYTDNRIRIVDRIKKMIRLASGLDENDKLSDESMQTAISCLEEFGQRIREIPQVNVRAVGTNTLRQANNSKRFLAKARKALGHPIEIISGREEARLIYLGVAHCVYDDMDKRLVIDIGGGSTELIIGKGFDITDMESFYIGCANMNRRYFGSGTITAKAMQQAILGVRQELESIEGHYRNAGWTKVIGSSGTILAINKIIKNKGWSNEGITHTALKALKKELIEVGDVNRLQLPGLTANRKPVFAGGVAILCGIFEAFDIRELEVSDGALREGLLHDLIGRHHDQDIRDDTIDELAGRYNIDLEQAARVRKTAVQLFEQLAKPWGLNRKTDLKFLEWGAQVHEIGLAIAHAQHHRHGAYLIANSDLAGFSRQEQSSLALLVRSHRRKYPVDEINLVHDDEKNKALRLIILLRLAVLINRSRLYASLPKISAEATDSSISLTFPAKWLESNPLTKTDLDSEAAYMKAVNYKLDYI